MSIRMLAHIIVIASLILGQASLAANFDSSVGLSGEGGVEFSMTSLLTSDENCVQDNCACSEPDCADGLMSDCAYAAGSARCGPSVLGSLISDQSPIIPGLSSSIPISYQVPLYHDISLGVTPRPPKPVV